MARVDWGELFEAVPDGLLVHDPDTGEILAINRTCSELLGYGKRDLVGADLSTLAADRPYTATGDHVRRASEEGSARFEWVAESATGEPVPVEISLATTTRDGREVALATVREAPDRGDGGRPAGDPDRPPDRYRALFESGSIVQWEFDLSAAVADARTLADRTDDLVDYLAAHPAEHERLLAKAEIVEVNDASLDIYGASTAAELVAAFDRLLTEDALATWRRLWGRLVEGGIRFRSECTTLTLDGERRDVLVEFTVPPEHADDFASVFVTGLDITERRRRERELERKNEFLDEFASVVSHDIATPLGVIENKAHLVEVTGDPSHAEGIFEATERIHELLDDLRELARQGEQVGETAPVDLGTVAREAWQSVETREAALTVVESTTVEADRDRFRQLLENLLENSVEHGSTGSRTMSDPAVAGEEAPDGGTQTAPDGSGRRDAGVTVRVGATAEGFYVADDGPGIPERDRESVFEQGYTTAGDSSGLGLAIVRRIADGHGWTVTASESDEGGARFQIRTRE